MPALLELLSTPRLTAERGGPIRWSDAMIIGNDRPLPPSAQASGGRKWLRGFNLLILAEDGHPSHFCKCRPADHPVALRELRILETLCSDERLRDTIPATWGQTSEKILLQISRYVRGERCDRRVSRQGADECLATLDAILENVRRVACVATERLSGEIIRTARIELAAECRPLIDYLAEAGATASDLRTLEGVVSAAGSVPWFPQHGDLWPKNVIRNRDGWWLLDFEDYGRISVPLYDFWHLARTSLERRGLVDHGDVSGPTWIDLIREEPAGFAAGLRQRLTAAARAFGLNVEQVRGSLIYYTLNVAVWSHRRQAAPAFWQENLGLLRRLSAGLAFGPIEINP